MNRTDLLARGHARRLSLLTALGAVLACLALHAAPASASTNQVALIQDGVALNENPYSDMAQMKALGATTVRVLMFWYQVAPDANSARAPRGFQATNPSSYPAANWAQWDAIVQAAHTEGLTVDLDITGAPPRWAQGKGVPSKFLREHYGWKVNAGDYGSFVRAVATRYDGRYKPKGATTALPKVSLYSIWNEPNFGQNLGPQATGYSRTSAGYLTSPRYYRNLLAAGWKALKADAKGSRILFGELAATGQGPTRVSGKYPQGLPGWVAISAPKTFLNDLYCLTSTGQPLYGKAGAAAGCPANAGARRSFVAQNPALFDATAFSMHPYASKLTPTAKASSIPQNDFPFPVIGRLARQLSFDTGAWHHKRNYDIWSTEFGYITSPPQTNKGGTPYPSPAQAAIYLNEAEYLSYRNPRISSYAQYLLRDPQNQRSQGIGLFASGLLFANGKPKPGYNAYRMPVWMPKQSVRKGSPALVWGGARPAVGARAAVKKPQQVQIQQKQHGSWKVLATATAAKLTGYINAHIRFTTTGALRLAYTYPASELNLPANVAGSTVYSRTIPVTAH